MTRPTKRLNDTVMNVVNFCNILNKTKHYRECAEDRDNQRFLFLFTLYERDVIYTKSLIPK